MAYRLLYLPGVEKDIQALPGGVTDRVRRGLERLAESPRLGKPLHGELAPFRSYRVGDYGALADRLQVPVRLAHTVDRVEELYVARSFHEDSLQVDPDDRDGGELADRRNLDAQALRVRHHAEVFRHLDRGEPVLEFSSP